MIFPPDAAVPLSVQLERDGGVRRREDGGDRQETERGRRQGRHSRGEEKETGVKETGDRKESRGGGGGGDRSMRRGSEEEKEREEGAHRQAGRQVGRG